MLSLRTEFFKRRIWDFPHMGGSMRERYGYNNENVIRIKESFKKH